MTTAKEVTAMTYEEKLRVFAEILDELRKTMNPDNLAKRERHYIEIIATAYGIESEKVRKDLAKATEKIDA